MEETAEPYDREAELKAFDDSKTGVKGLVDSGITSIPKIFIRPAGNLAEKPVSGLENQQVPIIDLGGVGGGLRRREIVGEISSAAEKWGFFQVVNHGIDGRMLNAMIEGIRRFNEQDPEVKKVYYSRDRKKKVRFNCNFDLFSAEYAAWRDTLTMPATDPVPEELPEACRLYQMTSSRVSATEC